MTRVTITEVKEFTEITPAGSTKRFYRVWFVTERGSTGSVDIPEADWRPDRAKEIVRERAERLDMLYELSWED